MASKTIKIIVFWTFLSKIDFTKILYFLYFRSWQHWFLTLTSCIFTMNGIPWRQFNSIKGQLTSYFNKQLLQKKVCYFGFELFLQNSMISRNFLCEFLSKITWCWQLIPGFRKIFITPPSVFLSIEIDAFLKLWWNEAGMVWLGLLKFTGSSSSFESSSRWWL